MIVIPLTHSYNRNDNINLKNFTPANKGELGGKVVQTTLQEALQLPRFESISKVNIMLLKHILLNLNRYFLID